MVTWLYCNLALCNLALCNLALCNLALCTLALCNLALCNLALCNLALCNLALRHLALRHLALCHWALCLCCRRRKSESMSQGKPSLNSCGSSTQACTQCSKNYRNNCRVQRLLLRSLASMLHVEMCETLFANTAGKFDFTLKDGSAHQTKRNKPATGSCPSQTQKSLCRESVCFCKAGSCNLALRKMALRNLAL